MNETSTAALAPPRAENERPDLRLLVLARSYPSPELPALGLWTQRLVHCVTGFAEVKVVSPVPYAPPMPPIARLAYFERFRRVARRRWDGPVEVLHPRMVVGPGASTVALEPLSYALAAGPAVSRLRRRFPFDMIHAHFTYPDGIVACMLGRRYGVPVMITEHAPWLPWMERAPLVRRGAAWAAHTCDALVPVSNYVRRTILDVMDADVTVGDPLPVLVDGEVFKPSANGCRKGMQLLFAGAVRHSKGADVLIEALAHLRGRFPDIRLVMAGDSWYRSYQRQFEQTLSRVTELGLEGCVEVVGQKSPADLAQLMSESAALVVPAREESFSAVAIEALACGTPVVATRCGGPEEIVTPAVGRLVPSEDPVALADALADVLDAPERYRPDALRRYALERFGAATVAALLADRYASVGPSRPPG